VDGINGFKRIEMLVLANCLLKGTIRLCFEPWKVLMCWTFHGTLTSTDAVRWLLVLPYLTICVGKQNLDSNVSALQYVVSFFYVFHLLIEPRAIGQHIH
jgi:hypothetical protein